MLTSLPRIALVVLLFASCGKGGNKKTEKHDGAVAPPVAAPISLPTLGVDKIARFNFGDSSKTHDLEKKGEWQELRKYAEAAVAKDAMNLEAQRQLGLALANTGEQAAAVDHLVAAIAGDYYKYGDVASEPALKDFLTTQHGQAVTQLAGQIRDEYAKRIKAALWLVGRRASFKWPDKPGVQAGYSRGEVYAYDRDNKRFYRLTHTGDQVAGFIRAKSGTEIAILGYDKLDRGKDPSPPLVARGWVQAFDTSEWKNTTPKMQLNPARAVSLYYGDGDQLLVGTAPATNRWDLGPWVVWSVDKSTGKMTKVATPLGGPRIELTLDEGRVIPGKAIEGITATWTGEPGRAPELDLGKGVPPIHVPESGQAAQETVAIAPGSGFVAFATAVDPCAKDTAPSLYVANGKTGALKHVLTAKSRFATRWIDSTLLAYEDGEGAIRIWDATTSRESQRIENKAGLALDVLSLAAAPLCKQAPPTAEQGGSGDEPMPPEEPVTKP